MDAPLFTRPSTSPLQSLSHILSVGICPHGQTSSHFAPSPPKRHLSHGCPWGRQLDSISECFELSKIPLISSKVDVWSAGILLYQILFGRRPFGHDQTQERILREDTIIKARKVEFPSRPSVSNEAKEFIRRCLTYNQEERPDVLTIAQDPYLIYSKK
ncbi:hypothetical protein L1987_73323 [Smallanthus sonchifolius]|uniref:Uncharacterized protein n=1 Tax=Smallanthus sonchifolius TaxID=185202 RepID=A0ACB9A0B0_9ASTR|nr:hypothetical protein L1987_73323 [Smallanthus sonchifolius]